MFFLTQPERFDVVVTDNLFGDILTDIGAAIAGGIGLAASGNIDPSRDEPEHVRAGPRLGAGHRRAGQGRPDRDGALAWRCCWPTSATRRPPAGSRPPWPRTSPRAAAAVRVDQPRSATRCAARDREPARSPRRLDARPKRRRRIRPSPLAGPPDRRYCRHDRDHRRYRSAAELVAEGVELYPVTDRVGGEGRRPHLGRRRARRPSGATRSWPTPGSGGTSPTTWSRADWTRRSGWTEPELVDRAALDVDPAAHVRPLRPVDLRGPQGLPAPATARARSARRPTPSASSARARRLAMAELPEELFLGSVEALVRAEAAWIADDPEKSLYLRPVPVRHRGRAGGAPGQRLHLPADGLPGRRVLPARGQAGQRLAVQGVRPRGSRRHRRGQVLGQLRRVPGRPGARRRAGLRPGRLARRGRAALGRGDGRDEPVLRLRPRRRRPPRHPRADRHAAARRHPRLAAARSPGTSGIPAEEGRISIERVAGRQRRRARSPRCSRAAPRRSSRRSDR